MAQHGIRWQTFPWIKHLPASAITDLTKVAVPLSHTEDEAACLIRAWCWAVRENWLSEPAIFCSGQSLTMGDSRLWLQNLTSHLNVLVGKSEFYLWGLGQPLSHKPARLKLLWGWDNGLNSGHALWSRALSVFWPRKRQWVGSTVFPWR